MNKKRFHALILVGGIGFFFACKRKDEPNKIIDGVPVKTAQTILPAQNAQQFVLLQRDSLNIIVPVVNRLALIPATFPELSGPDSQSRYTFQISEKHYGTASFTIQFRDSSSNVIDPIQTQTSTTTLQSVVITANGNSSLFSYSENLTLTLDTVGNVTSNKKLTGTSNFSGSSYSIAFTFVAPGANSTFQGLTNGSVNASGAGGNPSQNTSLTLIFSSNHTADGPITWEGESGEVHFESNGTGYVVTNQFRVLID